MRNSQHFVEEVEGLNLKENEIMVSFDVRSLFANVPIAESIQVIYGRLVKDMCLEERTIITAERIVEMLELCLRSTYCYQGVFYEGAAMGSPVSAVVANMYMEFFEELALETSPVKPTWWKRYVDDIFCILERGKENDLLFHLNSLRPEIQFTMELEQDRSLPFMDCLVKRMENGDLSVSVYRKSTHTNRYLHYTSHHPLHVRRGVVKCLLDRARKLITNGGRGKAS